MWVTINGKKAQIGAKQIWELKDGRRVEILKIDTWTRQVRVVNLANGRKSTMKFGRFLRLAKELRGRRRRIKYERKVVFL